MVFLNGLYKWVYIMGISSAVLMDFFIVVKIQWGFKHQQGFLLGFNFNLGYKMGKL
jgi:hypothetical protein